MYTVAVKRHFIAQHYLIGGDWGPIENHKHSHHYLLELQLHGTELDQHGYLVDIVEIEKQLNNLTAYYGDQTLNDLPEFTANNIPLNPSIERFSQILAHTLAQRLTQPNITSLTVKLWENDIAWASFMIALNTKTLPIEPQIS